MGQKMELKMELGERRGGGGIRLRPPFSSYSSSSSAATLSSSTSTSTSIPISNDDDDGEKGRGESSFDGREEERRRVRRWKRISFHFHHRLNQNLLLFLTMILLFFSPIRIFSVVEGNGEIESCVRLIHSSNPNSGGVGASAIGHIHGSSSQFSGGGGNNNLVKRHGGNGISHFLSSSSSSGGNNAGGGGLVGVTTDHHSIVQCQIRTLHPDLDIENLTSTIRQENGMMVDVKTITNLKLLCNDVLFFESGVSSGQLSALSDLHELAIEKCKLKFLPADFLSGVRHLRKLTINTGNSDWAARSLEISPRAFQQVSQLRHLHLGYNHMWSLPEGLLCQVGLLQTLNLTHNLLNDIDDLGLPGSRGSGRSSSLTSNRMLPFQNEYSQTSTVPPFSSSSPRVDGCLSDMKSLDLSFNSLRSLGSRKLQLARRLVELRVDHNWLEELEEDAFTGLGQLKKLNLSSNRLVALPASLFQHCKLLEDLDLRNNSLTALSPGLLEGLEHLHTLDLSINSLSSQWITSEAFKSLVRLVILNLSRNQLTHLAPSTFNELYSVQWLDLGNNLISSIEDGTFNKMSNLDSLNLGRNRLVSINSNMLNGLYVLQKLILDYNQIEKMESGALQNCTSLQDLSLVGNKLTNVPEAFRGLQLKTLDLGENRISSLNNESLTGLSQLYGLRLVDNQLEEVPRGFCDSVPKLRALNFAQNQIHKISSTAFVSCPELKVLRLDSNKLDALPTTLASQLPNLLWLNVSENHIRRADYTLLPATLEWFDVSHNQLETLGGAWYKNNLSKGSSSSSSGSNTGGNNNGNSHTGRGVDGSSSANGVSHRTQNQSPNQNVRLRVVDASHNQLSQLDHHAVPVSLEVLRLSHNRLNKVAPDTFSHSVHLRRVELIGNQLESISLSALRVPPIPAGKPLPEFFLGGNPILCNCEMEWLTRINQLSALRQHPTVLDLDAIVCRVSYSRTVTHIPLPDIKPQDFLCPYKSHCFALCHCCDFDACDCEMMCPSNCTCYHDDTWSANVVNCASTGTRAIPSRLPMDSTEVYLDGNNIPTLNSHAFIGRKNLRVLYLNASRVETINNKSFNGLQSLQRLHLENNLLKALHGYEFDHLTRLRELYLQDNLIETISNATFLPLKSLESLRLDGNRLVVFTVWQLSLNPYLVEIGLARNQWNCDCQFLHQLYGWVTDNSRKVVDLNQLQCVWNTTHKPGPHLIDYNRTCGSSWALMGLDGGFDFTFSPLPLIFGFISLVLLLIIIVIALILCRDNARLFLFYHFGIRMCPSDLDDEKLYDAYIIYSQKDEEFVAQKIADELETNDSYRLCLHYRDLISETGDLKEMMVGAVENSKSVVVILSRNFHQGEWASGEYRSAFHAVLKKSQKNTRDMKKVVIVFIDDIPTMEVNADIRSWVRQNRIKVIKWSVGSMDQRKHKKFWSKLKYSLPAPSSHYHSNITSNTTTATSASSGESATSGGVTATLKYTANGDGGGEQQHPIIVDELNRTITMNIGNKLWPYTSNNFVALPPKYQIPNSPSHHNQSQTGTLQSHLSLNHYNQSLHSQSSPLHHHHHNNLLLNNHHYHPPLPLTNPPKSPPTSSQSTDSTTTNGGDENNQSLQAPTSFSLLYQQIQQLQQQHKSPVPVPKLYNSHNSVNANNNGVLISNSVSTSGNNSSSSSSGSSGRDGGGSNSSNHGGGESYLSLEGEHVYSTLDPPSPQRHPHTQQLHHPSSRLLNNIHLPNGYTYQPQVTMSPQGQWHPPNVKPPTPKGTLTFGNVKSFKKDGSGNPVQTYLV